MLVLCAHYWGFIVCQGLLNGRSSWRTNACSCRNGHWCSVFPCRPHGWIIIISDGLGSCERLFPFIWKYYLIDDVMAARNRKINSIRSFSREQCQFALFSVRIFILIPNELRKIYDTNVKTDFPTHGSAGLLSLYSNAGNTTLKLICAHAYVCPSRRTAN